MNNSNLKSYVAITQAPPLDFQKDYVALPKNYGTEAYFAREDIKAIKHTVKTNLDTLNAKMGFIEDLKGKKVIIKPNLVIVFHKFGLINDDYPESTDPRVVDALVHYIKPYAKEIIIAESSGRGMPTRASFKIAGYDRLAKYHGIQLIPLEEQPVKRYILPKASVMKEILLPEIFHEVVTGNAFYISMPKMKTNLYTGVTLGFKNAMGLIPYNLRQRNHNYLINEKLVDMLYLFKPNLVIIDGIVGGEGNTPAPVDPVEARMIISGNNSVETDRVATRIMGLDPDEIKLISHATAMGFGDPNVEIIGKEPKIPFRPAIRNMFSEAFREHYPNVKVLLGHRENLAPKIANINEISDEERDLIATGCDGGCVPSIISALEYVRYMGHKTDFSFTLIIGAGIETADGIFYIDHTKKPYSIEDIRNLPEKKLAMGSCTNHLKDFVDLYIDGCMPKPGDAIFGIFKFLKLSNAIINPFKNRQLFPFAFALLKTLHIRKKLIRKGIWLDVPYDLKDKLYQPRALTAEEENQRYIEWPFPKMTKAQKKKFLKLEKVEI